MNGLDLFSGIGGITKALEGYVTPVAYCENDRYAQAVLLSRMSVGDLPAASIWDDVRTLKPSDVGCPVDVVYGGPPCQPWSSAGKRRGKSDERNMWPEALRVVEEFRPGHCFFENVDELAADPYLIEIVERLETLGYFVPWPLILAASDVGAPHQRDRIWIAAHLAGEPMGVAGQPRINGGVVADTDGDRCGIMPIQHEPRSGGAKADNRDDGQERPLADFDGKRSNGLQPREEPDANGGGQKMADVAGIRRSEGRPESKRLQGRYVTASSDLQIADLDTAGLPLFQRRGAASESHGRAEPDSDGWWAVEPGVGRVVHGLPLRMDRIKCLGNAVVPAQAREAFERLMGLK